MEKNEKVANVKNQVSENNNKDMYARVFFINILC